MVTKITWMKDQPHQHGLIRTGCDRGSYCLPRRVHGLRGKDRLTRYLILGGVHVGYVISCRALHGRIDTNIGSRNTIAHGGKEQPGHNDLFAANLVREPAKQNERTAFQAAAPWPQ